MLTTPPDLKGDGTAMRESTPVRPTFDVEALLTSSGGDSTVIQYRPTATIFSQGDRCEGVMYLRAGRVILTVRSDAGRECVVAMLGAGQFFGESCLAGRSTRAATATTTTTCSVRVIETATMKRLLHHERRLTDHFIAHMLARNIGIEQDLLDHLFNIDSIEKRLARAIASGGLRNGTHSRPQRPEAFS